MRIRKFTREDLPAIMAIQRKCPGTAVWQETDYLRMADAPGGLILVSELETTLPSKVLGFVILHRAIDEAELRNLAVDPDHQHQDVGRQLLLEARRRLLEAGVKRVFLEVRPSNKPALGLYFAAGFGLHSRRKDYYRDPPEDAYVLALDLFPPAVVSGPGSA